MKRLKYVLLVTMFLIMIGIIIGESGTIFIAHRGASNPGYTENTVSNFEYAINSGYKYVEFDVRFSKDNVPYIFRDDGNIENKNSTELSNYDTLEDALYLIEKYDVILVIEIKEEMTQEQFKLINELAKPFKNNIVFQVSSEKNFDYLFSEGYQMLILDFGQYSTEQLVEMSNQYDVYIGFNYYELTPEELQYIDENMEKDVYWTINDKKDIEHLTENYSPCAIMTDLPKNDI